MNLVRRRWFVPGLLLLGLVAALAGWWAAGAGDGDPRWSAPGTQPPPGAAAASSSAPPGSSAAGGDPAGPPAPAPPYVQPFAGQPGSTPHPRAPSPTAGVDLGDGSDGCDHGYGDRSVCVPWRFPAGVTDKCGWLRAHGYKPLKVNGRDRHGLDRDRDGIACDPGD